MPNSYLETIKNVIGSWLGQSSEETDGEQDAIAMLTGDHRRVDALVSEFKSAEEQEKKSICTKILLELTVHSRLEEELVYPLLQREGGEDKDLSDEAFVEHDCVKYLIQQLVGKGPTDERFDAKVTVLSEIVHHHVREEEREIFPSLRATDHDMNELGARLRARKKELLQQLHKKPDFADANGSGKKGTKQSAKGTSRGRAAAAKSKGTKASAKSKVAAKKSGKAASTRGAASKSKASKSSSAKSSSAKSAAAKSSSAKSAAAKSAAAKSTAAKKKGSKSSSRAGSAGGKSTVSKSRSTAKAGGRKTASSKKQRMR